MKLTPRHRSESEAKCAADLTARGVRFRYEEVVLEYEVPARTAEYTPDFELGNGILVEWKGYFGPEDKLKHLLVKAQHPDRDVRIVFENAHRKFTSAKRSKTYAQWCDDHDIPWAHQRVPDDWVRERRSRGEKRKPKN